MSIRKFFTKRHLGNSVHELKKYIRKFDYNYFM